jgi:signal transduction histidine kinase
VYAILVAGIFLVYFAIVIAITWFYKDVNITLISSLSAVFVAFLFNPLKNYVHSFVDKKFFKVQYNYREAVKSFFSEIKEINDIDSLSKTIITGISRFIPAEKAVLIDISNLNLPFILAQENFSNKDFHFFKDSIIKKHNLLQNIFLPEKIEPGLNSSDMDNILKEIKLSLVVISSVINRKIYLILAMGDKKSGSRYSAEDIDLLNNIINTAAAAAARIKLQEDLILKNIEAKKLMELNQQKSLFVSSVSHELKTPLTSIKMYSELIRMKEGSEKEKINNYAEYIEGESERLTRLINNVLSFSRIEKGLKQYYKEPVNLNEILKKVISIMEYQVKVQNFTLNSYLEEKEITIFADADALVDVFINLISNGIKYSAEKKMMNIYLNSEGENCTLTFQDFGIGIPEEEQKNLFKPYYRSQLAVDMKIPGTGLGLSIIKHTADAHNITIQVQSKLYEGTSIKLFIPKFQKESYEEHIIN